MDFLGRLGSHFLDVHATFTGGHDADLLGLAVDDDTDVEFFLDVGAFLDQQPADLLSFRAGLVGDQLHAEDGSGVLTDFIQRTGQLDAAALAAATGVDLGLDDPDGAAQLLGRLDRFFDIEAWNTPGHRYTIALQDFFALILVDFHGDLGWVTYAALMLSQRS